MLISMNATCVNHQAVSSIQKSGAITCLSLALRMLVAKPVQHIYPGIQPVAILSFCKEGAALHMTCVLDAES